jgi:hypothetical protein
MHLRHFVTRLTVAAGLLSAAAALTPLPVGAADAALGTELCDMLKKLLPEVRDYTAEGARAQLVMALAEDFEDDKLRQAWTQIDSATTASCPKDREAMLAVVKTATLAAALQ